MPEPFDINAPVYCVHCAQLQWTDFRGKPCQFCGGMVFAAVRPEPTFTAHDTRILKPMRIPTKERK